MMIGIFRKFLRFTIAHFDTGCKDWGIRGMVVALRNKVRSLIGPGSVLLSLLGRGLSLIP